MSPPTTLSAADRAILTESSIFNGLGSKEMTPILEASKIKIYDTGKTIMSSGDVGDGIYVVLDGQVSVFLPQPILGDDGAPDVDVKISLATLDRGACFGEYSLVDEKEVSATVQAITPVRLGYLSKTDFYQIANTDLVTANVIYRNLLHVLVSRCRAANMELDGGLLFY